MMKIYETCVKACREEYTYYDKKLRQRSYHFEKYILVLDEKAPFRECDGVHVISDDDFQKLFQALKKLKKDKENLLGQLDEKAPFRECDGVHVISDDDFQKLFQALKKLKKDKENLLGQLDDLRNFNDFQVVENKSFFAKLKQLVSEVLSK